MNQTTLERVRRKILKAVDKSDLTGSEVARIGLNLAFKALTSGADADEIEKRLPSFLDMYRCVLDLAQPVVPAVRGVGWRRSHARNMTKAKAAADKLRAQLGTN